MVLEGYVPTAQDQTQTIISDVQAMREAFAGFLVFAGANEGESFISPEDLRGALSELMVPGGRGEPNIQAGEANAADLFSTRMVFCLLHSLRVIETARRS